MTLSRRGLLAFDFGSRMPVAEPWLRVSRTAMKCRFEVTLPRDDAHHVPAAHAALGEADRIENLLSVFRECTEVSRVNRDAAACAVSASRELFTLLERCARLHADTGGAFDVTSTPLSRCWGFMRRAGRVPEAAVIDITREVVGMAHVRLNAGVSTVAFDRPGVELNFGAIGKGYAVDCLCEMLRGRDVLHALVSAGGSSLRAVGGRGAGWPVDINSPLLPGQRVARLLIRDGALGISGAGEQSVVVDGARYGHVIDPRTGWPARGVLSSSVVTTSAADADALSTAFLIGGADLARRYCDAHRRTLALLVLEDETSRPLLFGEYPGVRLEA
ncbi:MAG: FAD:protein FMN transferase [Longimicrobiales bacterium]